MEFYELNNRIIREFINKKYPAQTKELEEYFHIINSNVKKQKLSNVSDRFGPSELVGNIAIPVVINIVSNFLYDIFKKNINKNNYLRYNKIKIKNIRKLLNKLKKISNDEKLINELIDFTLLHIENNIEKL